MKQIFSIFLMMFVLVSCEKALAPSNEWEVQNQTQEVSLGKVSEWTGISEKDLWNLLGENTTIHDIEARGTEPFWYFSASGSTLVWQAPGESDIETQTFTGITLSASGSSYILDGTGISAFIALGSCSDGMSDITYAYSIDVTKQTENFNGCANID